MNPQSPYKVFIFPTLFFTAFTIAVSIHLALLKKEKPLVSQGWNSADTGFATLPTTSTEQGLAGIAFAEDGESIWSFRFVKQGTPEARLVYVKSGKEVWSSDVFPTINVTRVYTHRCDEHKGVYTLSYLEERWCIAVDAEINHPEVSNFWSGVFVVLPESSDPQVVAHRVTTEAYKRLAEGIDSMLQREKAEALKRDVENLLSQQEIK